MDHKEIDLNCQSALYGVIHFADIPGLVISRLMTRRDPSVLNAEYTYSQYRSCKGVLAQLV